MTNNFWSQTYSGLRFEYEDPSKNEYRLEDIAHQLSQVVRYGGACKYPFSVAQHSCALAAWILDVLDDPEFALYALFHDAAEAYLGDIRTPIKDHVAGIRTIEDRIQTALLNYVRTELDVPVPLIAPARMKELDRRIVHDERNVVMNPCPNAWYGLNGFDPLNASPSLFVEMSPKLAKALWLAMVEAVSKLVFLDRASRVVVPFNRKTIN